MTAAADAFFSIFGYKRMTEEQVIAEQNLKSLGKQLPTWEELEAEVARMRDANSRLPKLRNERKL